MLGVVGDGCVDVDRVDAWIGEQLIVVGEPFLDAILVTDFIQLRLSALADGHHVGIRVALVDRDKLGTEAETDNRDVDGLVRHGGKSTR